MATILYYVHDPMCSWCWGFEPTRRELFAKLPDNISVKRLLGGLAPDSELPMPEDTRCYLQTTWRKIQQTIPGTEFNFGFWDHCQPRRSTFPACRAVIAARMQGDNYDEKMTHAIQRAYYTEARNPSDYSTLLALAGEIGLEVNEFSRMLTADQTQQKLLTEIHLARKMNAMSFPGLVLKKDMLEWQIAIDYNNSISMFELIMQLTDSEVSGK